MTDQILRPRVIESTPFPGELEAGGSSVVTQTSGGVSIPNTASGGKFPTRTIAVETIGPALNTQSKKILGEFEFLEHGAFQIGKYIDGDTGEVKISPNGILTRDKTGAYTFTLDGLTGSATFMGTLQAGTIIGGGSNVVIEAGGEDGRILLYNQGVPNILIGDPS